ncbi:MAG: MBL fold metallo-hydrolase [Myxococcota bacterium]
MPGQPDIQIIPLGSGSKGNCTFVGTPYFGLVVDNGFSVKELMKRLAAVRIPPSRIHAILVTHEHSDHIGGVGPLARKLNVPVFLTRGTYEAGQHILKNLPEIFPVSPGETFELAELKVEPIPLPHDAREPVAYAFEWGGRRWAIFTDLGHPSHLVVERARQCDVLLVEANHDEELLINGPYPWSLKQRIRGRQGHLSNTQGTSIVEAVVHPGLKGIALMHLSETNNRPEIPYALCRAALQRLDAADIPLWVAPQERPLEGLSLKSV